MFKKLLAGIFLSFVFTAVFAESTGPNFVLLPNIKTQDLMTSDAIRAIAIENQTIELVKKTLNITKDSPYRTVRIRIIYSEQSSEPKALIVYLLSNKFKLAELIRIDLNNHFVPTNIIQHYKLQEGDIKQTPFYALKREPTCPDETVQFVIGNNFRGDTSVEKEVQKVYQWAKEKGYNPFLMDTNDRNGPQPTIEAYEDWLSCKNVKGFYNESHGWDEGIVLTDGDLTYYHVEKDLLNKLSHEIILLDSCETFRNPLLKAVVDADKGNSQQYMAGYISLPFGSSERTASCFWNEAFNHQDLNQQLIRTCAIEAGLEPDGFRITGNGDNHLIPAA